MNNDTMPRHLSTAALQAKLDHRELHFPGTIRQAEALLKVENEDHRLVIDAEAHLAANMTGGRVSDHRDQLVAAYLRAERPQDYIDYLRDGQRRIAEHKRF